MFSFLFNGSLGEILAPTKSDVERLYESIQEGRVDVAVKLIQEGESGLDPNLPNSAGNRPIHMAAHAGYISIIEALVNHGADINSRGRNENTALHFAAIEGHGPVVNFLVVNGADTALVNKGGKTAYDLASTHSVRNELLPYRLDGAAGVSGGSVPGMPVKLATQNNKDDGSSSADVPPPSPPKTAGNLVLEAVPSGGVAEAPPPTCPPVAELQATTAGVAVPVDIATPILVEGVPNDRPIDAGDASSSVEKDAELDENAGDVLSEMSSDGTPVAAVADSSALPVPVAITAAVLPTPTASYAVEEKETATLTVDTDGAEAGGGSPAAARVVPPSSPTMLV